MPSTLLSIAYTFSYEFNLCIRFRKSRFYNHFMDEDIEAQRGGHGLPVITQTVRGRATADTQSCRIPKPRFLVTVLHCSVSQDQLRYAALTNRQLQNLRGLTQQPLVLVLSTHPVWSCHCSCSRAKDTDGFISTHVISVYI